MPSSRLCSFVSMVSVVVLTYLTSGSQSCLLSPDWQQWSLSNRTQQAEVIVVGNVKQYLPVFGDDPTTAIFYTAEIDVACVYGVSVDASDIAKNLYLNKGLVNVTGFNALLNDCVHADIVVDMSYIVMVVGEWNGGNMRPDQINAQPSIVNATAENLRELEDAMTEKRSAGYRLTSGTCATDNAIDIGRVLGQKDGPASRVGVDTTQLPPHKVKATTDPGGHGHRVVVHWMIVLLTTAVSVFISSL